MLITYKKDNNMNKAQEDFLEVGDVVKADASWSIRGQNHSTNSTLITQDERFIGIEFVKVTGANSSLPIPDEEGRKKLHGKNFLVVKAEKAGGGVDRLGTIPNGHFVTLERLSKQNQRVRSPLQVAFYQSGAFTCSVKHVNVIGHMKPTFDAFKPAK